MYLNECKSSAQTLSESVRVKDVNCSICYSKGQHRDSCWQWCA